MLNCPSKAILSLFGTCINVVTCTSNDENFSCTKYQLLLYEKTLQLESDRFLQRYSGIWNISGTFKLSNRIGKRQIMPNG